MIKVSRWEATYTKIQLGVLGYSSEYTIDEQCKLQVPVTQLKKERQTKSQNKEERKERAQED